MNGGDCTSVRLSHKNLKTFNKGYYYYFSSLGIFILIIPKIYLNLYLFNHLTIPFPKRGIGSLPDW